MKRKFSGEKKFSIVIECIKGDKSVSEIARKHDISPSLVSRWLDQAMKTGGTLFDRTESDKTKDKKLKYYEQVISKLTTQTDFLEKVLGSLD